MALTRKMLKGMGLNEEQIDTIIDAHSETVDGLKADLKKAEDKAGEADSLRKRAEAAEKDLDESKKDGWKDKHDSVKKEFDDYKAEMAKKETRAAKEKAYREILKEAGISEKRMDTILRVTDLDKIELDGDKVKDAAAVTESVKKEWADLIVKENTTGANTTNPNQNTGGRAGKSKEEIMAIKDGHARRQAMLENPQLFGLSAKTNE